MSDIIKTDKVNLTSVGLTVVGALAFDEWIELMSTLVRLETAFQFAIGDALLYGESKFGEKYSQAMDATGMSYQSLANMVWVARRVPMCNRVVGVSWTHHRVIASIDPTDQRLLLEMARDSDMPATSLQTHISGKEPRNRVMVEVPAGITTEDAMRVIKEYADAVKAANSSQAPSYGIDADATLENNPLCDTCPHRTLTIE